MGWNIRNMKYFVNWDAGGKRTVPNKKEVPKSEIIRLWFFKDRHKPDSAKSRLRPKYEGFSVRSCSGLDHWLPLSRLRKFDICSFGHLPRKSVKSGKQGLCIYGKESVLYFRYFFKLKWLCLLWHDSAKAGLAQERQANRDFQHKKRLHSGILLIKRWDPSFVRDGGIQDN